MSAPGTVDLADYAGAARFFGLARSGPVFIVPSVMLSLEAWWAAKVVGGAETFPRGWWLEPGGSAEPPVILIPHHTGLTLAAARVDLLAGVGIEARLIDQIGSWQKLQAEWSKCEGEARGLQAAIAGGDVALPDWGAVLADNALREAFTSRQPAVALAAGAELLLRLHQHPASSAYARFLTRLESDPWAPLPEDLGPWRTSALARIFDWRAGLDRMREETYRVAWELWRESFIVDAGLHRGAPLFIPAHAADARHRLAAVATVLGMNAGRVPAEWTDDPWWIAVEAAQDDAYDGIAHMRVSAELDLAGRYAEAWKALTTASLILHHSTGKVPPSVRDAARLIARGAGWGDVAALLGTAETAEPELPS